jgi:hypothetical protein
VRCRWSERIISANSIFAGNSQISASLSVGEGQRELLVANDPNRLKARWKRPVEM